MVVAEVVIVVSPVVGEEKYTGEFNLSAQLFIQSLQDLIAAIKAWLLSLNASAIARMDGKNILGAEGSGLISPLAIAKVYSFIFSLGIIPTLIVRIIHLQLCKRFLHVAP